MPCLRSLGKVLKVYDLPGRGHAAWPTVLQVAVATQPRAALTDIVCEPATGTPAHPFQPVASSSTTGDTFVPKGAKLSGHGAHPLARYRYSSHRVSGPLIELLGQWDGCLAILPAIRSSTYIAGHLQMPLLPVCRWQNHIR